MTVSPPPDPSPVRRLRRSLWATAAFLMGFAILLSFVVFYYLVPATDAAHHADATGRRQLSAFSTLLLAVLLFVLLVGLLMTFRIHRFFFPRPSVTRTTTQHVDAWKESANRIEVPSRDADEDEEDELE